MMYFLIIHILKNLPFFVFKNLASSVLYKLALAMFKQGATSWQNRNSETVNNLLEQTRLTVLKVWQQQSDAVMFGEHGNDNL